ncbi:MAG: hypothetical protein U0167_12895 [bacterium]
MNRASLLVQPALRRNLRAIFAEGAAYSVMVGVGETYIPAFVLALGMGEVASGLISTIPLLAGGLIQLAAPSGVRRVGSPRTWSLMGAGAQAAGFVPLAVGAWIGGMPGALVFASATLYWGAGMAIGPAWNVWVERLVPPFLRARYFARRSSVAQLCVLIGLLVGGLTLQFTAAHGKALVGFGILFTLAAAARFYSIRYFVIQTDVKPGTFAVRGFPALTLLRKMPSGAGPRLLGYMLALTATVMIAGPFFSAYMLRQLALPYWTYMAIVGTSIAAKVVALPFLGAFARRFGLGKLLRLAWVGIMPMAALWLVSDRVEYLIALQIFSGVAWAAHEYATFLLLFDTIRAEHRTSVLTAYNLGNAVATVAGSLVGGWLFERVGSGIAGYRTLFAASSLLRLACVVLMLQVETGAVPSMRPAFRLIAANPVMGAVLRPILATVRPRPRLVDRVAAQGPEDAVRVERIAVHDEQAGKKS